MMWTDEHKQISKTVRKFVETEINPFVDEWEAAEEFPIHDVLKKMGNLGLLGVRYPEEFGGLGLDFSYSVVCAEALGNIDCGGVPMAIGVHTDMCTPALARFGSDELRHEFLAPAISGDVVGSVGVSEPNAGSDVAGLRTWAKGDGDDYVVNGTKMWITNGMKADWCCVLANTSDEGGPHHNKSLIMVPLNLKGVTRQKIKKIGMNSSDTAQLFFDDVRVPKRNVIGQEGMGFAFQMLQFQEERLWGAANAITGFDRVIDKTIEYTKAREAFGKPLIENQAIYFRLAELRTEVELLRSLVHRATQEYVDGKDVTRLASMAKLKFGRLAREVTDSCMQYWGGMGYSYGSYVGRAFRDTRLLSIGGGADEVMLNIIAKFEDTLPRGKKKKKGAEKS
ncbi:MAG: acyl-CoA dehydrogenase [Deltaproteobacteria bacterium]|nr:acyl-CoA dehydrogenase [Deltaproteobacteria bacterium]